MGLIHRARSASDRPLRRCSPQDRTWALILFRASLLIAGLKPVIILPVFVRTPLARKAYPRNVNDVCSHEPGRLPSCRVARGNLTLVVLVTRRQGPRSPMPCGRSTGGGALRAGSTLPAPCCVA